MDLQWKKKMDLQEDQLSLQAQSKGRLPSEQFPQMLTDMFGAPVMNACDTVVDVGLAMLRLGDQPSDLQRQQDYLWDLCPHSEGDELLSSMS